MIEQGTVFLVDDDDAVARSLRRVIESAGGTAQMFCSAEDFLAAYAGERGCLLLDVRMPGMGGLELQDRLLAAQVDLPIVFMSGHGDVPMAARTLRKGAVDFLEKPFRDDALLERLEEAIGRHLEQGRARERRVDRDRRLGRLTDRERQVMEKLVAGQTVKEIAFDLGLSHKTVHVHRANILVKTKSRSVVDLARITLLPDAEDEAA